MRVEVVNLQFPFMLLILTSFFAYFSVISFYIYSPVMGSLEMMMIFTVVRQVVTAMEVIVSMKSVGSENFANNINGGRGDDPIYGGKASDTIIGNDGHDAIDGDAGDDVLFKDGKEMTQYLVKKVAMRLLVIGLGLVHHGEQKTIIFIKTIILIFLMAHRIKFIVMKREDDFAYISESDGDIAGDGCEHI